MQTHEFELPPDTFWAVKQRRRPFDIRRDRHFRADDVIVFNERKDDGVFTGEMVCTQVVDVFKDEPGIADKHCVLVLRVLSLAEAEEALAP